MIPFTIASAGPLGAQSIEPQPGCTTVLVGTESNVTPSASSGQALRPQPKGLGQCAESIGAMASYCMRPHPRLFGCGFRKTFFYTNEISQGIG